MLRVIVEGTSEGTLIFEQVKSINGCIVLDTADDMSNYRVLVIGEHNDVDRIKITARLLYDVVEQMVLGFSMSEDVVDAIMDDFRHDRSAPRLRLAKKDSPVELALEQANEVNTQQDYTTAEDGAQCSL